jgi:hypothetical protein
LVTAVTYLNPVFDFLIIVVKYQNQVFDFENKWDNVQIQVLFNFNFQKVQCYSLDLFVKKSKVLFWGFKKGSRANKAEQHIQHAILLTQACVTRNPQMSAFDDRDL